MSLIRSIILALSLAAAPLPSIAQELSGLPPVSGLDRVLGRSDAPVTVIEYASFVCSHCADWHTTVYPAFKARYVDTGLVRLVFRDLPTQPVQVGATAAGIGRCAAPGRFFDVASVLMTGQQAIIDGGPVVKWYADAVAVSGKTPAEIDQCLADPATLNTIRAEISGATAAGVQGTPTFFVNGHRIADTSLDGLSAAILPQIVRR